MEEKHRVYLGTNLLQKDMRIRIPKQILENLDVIAGESEIDIYIDPDEKCLIMKKSRKE